MDPKSEEPTRDGPERDFLYTNYSKGPQAKGWYKNLLTNGVNQ